MTASATAAFKETTNSNTVAKPKDVGLREVSTLLQRLFAVKPELLDVESTLRKSGFSPSAQNILLQRLPALPEVGSADVVIMSNIFAESLAPWLDRLAWEDVAVEIEAIIAAPGHEFTTQNITTLGNPWHRFVLGFLGSQHVRPTRSVQFTAGLVGLGGFISLWKKAQRSRAELRRHTKQAATDSASNGEVRPLVQLETSAHQLVTRALQQLHGMGPDEECNTSQSKRSPPAVSTDSSAENIFESIHMLDKVLAAVNILGPIDPDTISEFTWCVKRCPISWLNFISFNNISNILRYSYEKPPYNNRK